MRHYFTWVGIICAMMLLCAVDAGATTPFGDDLPGVRMLRQGGGSLPGGPAETVTGIFDLDEYVIDNNNPDSTLGWVVATELAQGVSPAITIQTGNTVDVGALSPAGVWSATYTVTDPSAEFDSVSSVKKYSDFWLSEPKFTSDSRLTPLASGAPRFTYVKLFDGSGTPEALPILSSYVEPPSAVSFPTLIVHEWDSVAGTWTEFSRGSSVTAGGLAASVSLTGALNLTPSNQVLTCAVLIAIPAVAQGSSLARDGNWDGQVILVAPAKSFERFTQATYITDPAVTLAMNTRFEDVQAGAPLQPDGAAATPTTAAPIYFAPGWNAATSKITSGTGTIRILGEAAVTSVAPGQFPGSTSGNALAISLDDNQSIELRSFNIPDVTGGQVIGVSVNVATDIPSSASAQYAGAVLVQLSVKTQPDNGQTVKNIWFRDTVLSETSLPMDGQWKQLYCELVVPTLNRQVDNTLVGGVGTTNMMNKGLRTSMQFGVKGLVPGSFNVYVDNYYVYCKGASDLNITDANDAEGAGGLVEEGLANGMTAAPAFYSDLAADSGAMIDGGFESGSTLAANYWIEGPVPGLINGDTGLVGIETVGRVSNQSFYCELDIAATRWTRGEKDGNQVRSVIAAGSSTRAGVPTGGKDLTGPGVYGISFWVSSDAADVRENPRLQIGLSERQPTRSKIGKVLINPTTIPTANDGWNQYSLVANFGDQGAGGTEQLGLALFNSAISFPSVPSFGPYTGNDRPGYDADARVLIEDVVLHKVDTNSAYFNYSLFD